MDTVTINISETIERITINVYEGVPGKSAYEVALDNGFVGTEAEWLQSLQGSGGGTSIELPENEILLADDPDGVKSSPDLKFIPPMVLAPSYGNYGGTGNRLSILAISASPGLTIGGLPTALIDGSMMGSLYFLNAGSNAGAWFKFDFGVSRRIVEAKWYQDLPSTHGNWKWQASPDDSGEGSWVDIGNAFVLGGATTQVQNELAGNLASYRYYRLIAVSGNFSGSPYLLEIEFKLDGNTGHKRLVIGAESESDISLNGSLYFADGSRIFMQAGVLKFQDSVGTIKTITLT